MWFLWWLLSFLFVCAWGKIHPIQLSIGTVKGKRENARVCSYVGIPYGKANRWSKPQMVEKLPNEPFQAIKEPAPCPQAEAGIFLCEDCLKLSVYVTMPVKEPRKSNLPVIFWIYGGAFTIGGAWENGMYTGKHLCSQMDCILVTFNYRVGAFGWMVSETFGGNYGLHDQILALQWVKRHIFAFGGNPENIMLMGESAGAFSALLLLQTLEESFKSAIVLSPPLALQFPSRQHAKRQGNALLARLGCKATDENCARAASARQIITYQPYIANIAPPASKIVANFLVHMPVIDGEVVLEHPMVWKAKNWKIPVVIGNNLNEMSLLAFLMNPSDSDTGIPTGLFSHLGYISMLQMTFKEHAEAVLHKYPAKDCSKDNWELYLDLLTDYVFRCPTRRLSQSQPHSMLYHYRYIQGYLKRGICSRKSCHSTEVPLIFSALPSTKSSYLSVSNGASHDECLELLESGSCKAVKIWKTPRVWIQCSACRLIEQISNRADFAFTEEDRQMISSLSIMIGKMMVGEKPWEPFSSTGKLMSIFNGEKWDFGPEKDDICDFWDSIAPDYNSF